MVAIKSLLFGAVAALPLVSAGPVKARDTPNCPGTGYISADQQRQLWNDFVNVFFIEKNVTQAYDLYVSPNIIEHNPFIADGAAAAIAALAPLIPLATFDILHDLFDGGIGNIHAKVTVGSGAPSATGDWFRYDGSCIVEHWDISESVPANATNPHPLF